MNNNIPPELLKQWEEEAEESFFSNADARRSIDYARGYVQGRRDQYLEASKPAVQEDLSAIVMRETAAYLKRLEKEEIVETPIKSAFHFNQGALAIAAHKSPPPPDDIEQWIKKEAEKRFPKIVLLLQDAMRDSFTVGATALYQKLQSQLAEKEEALQRLAERNLEIAREVIEKEKEIERLRGLLEIEVKGQVFERYLNNEIKTDDITERENLRWKSYCEKNNITPK